MDVLVFVGAGPGCLVGELRDMADEVIRTQTAENDRIGTWLEKWYGRAVDDEHMDHHEDMQVLRKRPAPSSRFASSMSFHQPQAIELAREVATPP